MTTLIGLRLLSLLTLLSLFVGGLSPAQSQSPELIEAARRAAYPPLPPAAEPLSKSILLARGTALGCDLIPDLPLPDPIEIHRLEFALDDAPYAVHISAAGGLTQVCDERFPNLGAGLQPIPRAGFNSAGDNMPDSEDPCLQQAAAATTGCGNLPARIPSPAASGAVEPCPADYNGFLPPRVSIGQSNARIVSATLANRLRAQPDYRAEQIGEIPPGSLIDAVLAGPVCQAHFVWWLVEADGQIGWTVESDIKAYHYYLEPVASENTKRPNGDLTLSESEQPQSQRRINSANLDSLDTAAVLRLPSPIAVAWSPGQMTLAAASAAGDIALFNAPDFAPIAHDLALPAPASAIAFSPAGKWLTVGHSDGKLALIELNELNGSLQAAQTIPLGAQAGSIRALAWNQAGDKLAVISGDETLKIARQAGALTVWRLDLSAPAASEPLLRYRYAYPLTAAAFSQDGRWLAISGESSGERRAALWVYEASSGDLAFSKALTPTRGRGFVLASPSADLGDFIYSSGDSLYHLRLDNGAERRFYHLAGAILADAAFRPGVIPAAEALMALTAESETGASQLRIVNALNPRARAAVFSLAPSAIAFSPDGRLLAIAEPMRDRIRLAGLIADTQR